MQEIYKYCVNFSNYLNGFLADFPCVLRRMSFNCYVNCFCYTVFCAGPQELFLRALNGIPIPAEEAADVPVPDGRSSFHFPEAAVLFVRFRETYMIEK